MEMSFRPIKLICNVRGIGVAVVDLDFVPDLTRRLGVVGRGDHAPFGARRIADRDAAIAGTFREVLHMQVEFAEVIARGVEPRLRVHPSFEGLRRSQRTAGDELLEQIGGALSHDCAVGEYGPLAVADDLPPVQILSVKQRLGVGGE